MKNILQISYWTIGGFEGKKPLDQAIRETRALGFAGLELAFGAGEFSPGISAEKCREIAAYAKQQGVTLASTCTGVYWGQSLTSPRPEVRRQAVAFTKDYLRATAAIGAKVALVVPGAVAVPWDQSQPIVPYAEAWKRATAGLRQCAPLAKKLGVFIGVENVWNWFLADPIAMREFVDQFSPAAVGVYFDLANCLINGFPEHWLAILGRRVKAIHVKNFQRQDCGGGLHGFGDDLLKGDVNWQEVKSALRRIRYRGPLTAEMIPFSRLPNLVLPDMKLAEDTSRKLRQIFGN